LRKAAISNRLKLFQQRSDRQPHQEHRSTLAEWALLFQANDTFLDPRLPDVPSGSACRQRCVVVERGLFRYFYNICTQREKFYLTEIMLESDYFEETFVQSCTHLTIITDPMNQPRN